MAEHHKWSQSSANKLKTCDEKLQYLFNKVLELFPHDVTIIEGTRSNERQEQLFLEGKSKLRAGQSRHNTSPSKAVDVAPIVNGRIDWKDRELWLQFSGFVKGLAAAYNIDVIWGGDWDGDFDSAEHGFWDGPHWELKEK